MGAGSQSTVKIEVKIPTIKYHKRVCDHIPGIIKASGRYCVYSTLSQEEYDETLDEKLNEELADLLEVIHVVAVAW